MNFLNRVFGSRIAKPRRNTADQRQDNTSRSSPRSPIKSRRAPSPGSRAGSGKLAPVSAKAKSPHQSQAAQGRAATIPDVRIKQEDKEEDGVSAMLAYEEPGVVAQDGQTDGTDQEMITGDPLNGAAAPESSVEEQSSEEDGSFVGDSIEVAGTESADEEGIDTDREHTDMNSADEEDVSEAEADDTVADTLNSDEPLQSIEANDAQDDDDDDDDEEEEEDRSEQEDEEEEEPYEPREKTPNYLHGMTHRHGGTPRSEASGGDDDEGFATEDEDFEEELVGEMEPNLLIDEMDLRYWLHHKRATTGIEAWPSEACRLYKLLFLRGSFPMFPSGWAWNFSQEPVPRWLFTAREDDAKCFVKTEVAEHRASDVLRPLFKLHITISSLRATGTEYSINRMAWWITRHIKQYVKWAEQDAGFWKKRDYISPVFIIAAQAASTGRPIVEKCQRLVGKYRAGYAARGIEDYPRCIYIFVLVQHVVLVMVADTEKPAGEEPYSLAELDLSQRSHWLDYTLAISITVLMARDALISHRSSLAEIDWETDDPDQ